MSGDTDLLRPLAIGPLRTRNNLVLSPMSGVTDCAFRMTVLEASGRESVGLLVSEFVAAEGLSRDNAKTIQMLRYNEIERPFSIQIFGADVDRMVRAALMVEEIGADIVDINCGCPAPKVVRRGGGAQLMRTPEVLRDILRGVRAAVSIPVTVKIRAGWDDATRNAVDFAQMVEDEGAAMLAVHGRTRLQLYSGEADWDLIGEVRQKLSIPVLGSGDVVDAEGALARLRGGYADGIMIGRGAIANPWIFGQTAALAQKRGQVEKQGQVLLSGAAAENPARVQNGNPGQRQISTGAAADVHPRNENPGQVQISSDAAGTNAQSSGTAPVEDPYRSAGGQRWVPQQFSAEPSASLSDFDVPQPTTRDRVELLVYFAKALAETKELRSYLGRLRGLACHMAKGLPGGAATRRVLGKATTAADIERIVREFLLEGRRFDDCDENGTIFRDDAGQHAGQAVRDDAGEGATDTDVRNPHDASAADSGAADSIAKVA